MPLSIEDIEQGSIPQHVAIIMDGNGRWAKQRGKDRSYGHQAGVTALRKIVESASRIGIRYLTVYTFSIENWNRPEEEVIALMELLVEAIRQETDDLIKNNVSLLAIGDIDRLPEKTRTSLNESIQRTSHGTGLSLQLALSYSSRWEITEAVRRIAQEVRDNKLRADEVTEQIVSEHLTTSDIPDPDLLIRTGGERRISNFMMWQLSYAELYFTDTFWPDFDEAELCKAIHWYQNRERRFGMTSEQIFN